MLPVPVVLLRSEAAENAGLLVPRHENTVLHRRLASVRHEPADRFRFAALALADNLIHAGRRQVERKISKRSRARSPSAAASTGTA
ncbi:hypothetical protein ACFFSW_17275 [Saccharothrix longispora]|uniref:Uncharacterized protein n=1 Tax=Saccharothrix longispora TaxID=33920 RepID=A0ABU1PPF8_9PSEU|nr:hypothetical protein [Saccharothrix longispora]MDR6592550.1 hypothetical protein [Saccharothrix longispora]